MEYIIAHTTIVFDLFALIATAIFVLVTVVCIMRMHDLKQTRRELEEQLKNSNAAPAERTVVTGAKAETSFPAAA